MLETRNNKVEITKILSILLLVGLFVETSKDLTNKDILINIGIFYIMVKSFSYIAIAFLFLEKEIKRLNIRYFIIGLFIYFQTFKIKLPEKVIISL